MPFGRTVTGKGFEYSGSLANGMEVHHQKGGPTKIPLKVIDSHPNEIEKRSPVLVGACRKPLVANSVVETLWLEHHVSPQVMSYILPLLIEEGFCRISAGKPFCIHRNRT